MLYLQMLVVRAYLARTTNICKYNIGTELRAAFGDHLRRALTEHPDQFDRVQILSTVEDALVARTQRLLEGLNNKDTVSG